MLFYKNRKPKTKTKFSLHKIDHLINVERASFKIFISDLLSRHTYVNSFAVCGNLDMADKLELNV